MWWIKIIKNKCTRAYNVPLILARRICVTSGFIFVPVIFSAYLFFFMLLAIS